MLRPPGVLGLLGNGFDVRVPWVRSVAEALGSGGCGRGRGRRHWPEAAELHRWFDAVEDGEFAHEQELTRATLLDLAQSRSSVATLPDADRRALLARLDRLWDEQPALRGRGRGRGRGLGREGVALPWVIRVRRARGLSA